MIIEVERYYKNSGIIAKIMINTDYIRTIEGAMLEDAEFSDINCRIVMEGTGTDPHIFYVTDKYSTLKTKIMGRRKK